jgi:hypothetical protein
VRIVKKDAKNQAYMEAVTLSKELVSRKPILMDKENVKKIANELLNETYGWGGKDFQRDCSSTLRDFYTPFGIFLPRNSKAQADAGEYVSLEAMDVNQKEEFILKNGIPFFTLVYLKGHIMLYVGEYNNQPIMMHNSWGIKAIVNNQPSRLMIGKTAFTTLKPAIQLSEVDGNATLANRVLGISYIASPKVASKN